MAATFSSVTDAIQAVTADLAAMPAYVHALDVQAISGQSVLTLRIQRSGVAHTIATEAVEPVVTERGHTLDTSLARRYRTLEPMARHGHGFVRGIRDLLADTLLAWDDTQAEQSLTEAERYAAHIAA